MKHIYPILGMILVCTACVSRSENPSAAPVNSPCSGEVVPKTFSTEADAEQASVEVTHCNDGDTCRVLTRAGKLWFNVRLAGVDAPEVGGRGRPSQELAEAARDWLNANLKGKSVLMRQVDLDQWNRPVAEFVENGRNINLALVEEGFAEAWRGKTKRINPELYFEAEKKAKGAGRGIWGIKNRISPGEWRKKR